MKIEFEGIITMIWQEETVWANNSRKVTFVIEELDGSAPADDDLPF